MWQATRLGICSVWQTVEQEIAHCDKPCSWNMSGETGNKKRNTSNMTNNIARNMSSVTKPSVISYTAKDPWNMLYTVNMASITNYTGGNMSSVTNYIASNMSSVTNHISKNVKCDIP